MHPSAFKTRQDQIQGIKTRCQLTDVPFSKVRHKLKKWKPNLKTKGQLHQEAKEQKKDRLVKGAIALKHFLQEWCTKGRILHVHRRSWSTHGIHMMNWSIRLGGPGDPPIQDWFAVYHDEAKCDGKCAMEFRCLGFDEKMPEMSTSGAFKQEGACDFHYRFPLFRFCGFTCQPLDVPLRPREVFMLRVRQNREAYNDLWFFQALKVPSETNTPGDHYGWEIDFGWPELVNNKHTFHPLRRSLAADQLSKKCFLKGWAQQQAPKQVQSSSSSSSSSSSLLSILPDGPTVRWLPLSATLQDLPEDVVKMIVDEFLVGC